MYLFKFIVASLDSAFAHFNLRTGEFQLSHPKRQRTTDKKTEWKKWFRNRVINEKWLTMLNRIVDYPLLCLAMIKISMKSRNRPLRSSLSLFINYVGWYSS